MFFCFEAIFVCRVPVFEDVGRPNVNFIPAAGVEGGRVDQRRHALEQQLPVVQQEVRFFELPTVGLV